MSARAEATRPLRSCLSASQSAQRSVRVMGKDMPPPESKPGATYPLFAVDLAPAVAPAVEHQGLLPVRADTLGSVCEANKARPSGMPKAFKRITAEQIGFCLICGSTTETSECSCHTRHHQVTQHDLLTLLCLVKQTANEPEIHWHICTTQGCKTLLVVPDNRPAVRCPVCDQVTQDTLHPITETHQRGQQL